MPRIDLLKYATIQRTPRVIQLEGLFEIPPSERSEKRWTINIPIEDKPWAIGLIVGPSGSGKSSIIHEAWPKNIIKTHEWPAEQSIIDAFPKTQSIKEIVNTLSSVGFSSPPSWLRPYAKLSNGEQFRVTLARAISEAKPNTPFVIDEYTSVVDRTVAQIGSAAIAKTTRQKNLQFIAAAVHYDIIDWLQPDWILDTGTEQFQWRSVLPRPPIDLQIRRTTTQEWNLFKNHHYLDTSIHVAATCFIAEIQDKPAAFSSVLAFPHADRPGWREHRTVCLPDYQGVGIGNALSNFVASLYQATGKPYRSTTGSPSMIYHRAKSDQWKMTRPPQRSNIRSNKTTIKIKSQSAYNRFTASFEYVGPANHEDAARFGILKNKRQS